MKKYLPIIIAALFFSTSVYCQSYNGPESVEYYAPTHHYFIGNTSSHAILERDAMGNLTTFASGLVNGPYGLEIVNDTLYACSGGSIKAFQIPGGNLLYILNLGGTFLNGITHDDAGNIFTTDFNANKIYRANIYSHQFNVFVTGLSNSPNGIVFDSIDHKLVFVNWGSNVPVQGINLADSSVSTLTSTTLDNCDGIAMTTTGDFIISSWGQQACNLFDHAFSNSPSTIITGLHNPADLGYNAAGDTLAIPNSGNNTVVFLSLAAPNSVQPFTSSDNNIFYNPNTCMATWKQNTISSLKLFSVDGQLIESSNTGTLNLFKQTQGIYVLVLTDKQGNELQHLKIVR